MPIVNPFAGWRASFIDSDPKGFPAIPITLLAHRLQTKKASLKRFKYWIVTGGILSRRASATQSRSARRLMVRQICNSTFKRDPPGRTKECSSGNSTVHFIDFSFQLADVRGHHTGLFGLDIFKAGGQCGT